jgi:hypothetical protein
MFAQNAGHLLRQHSPREIVHRLGVECFPNLPFRDMRCFVLCDFWVPGKNNNFMPARAGCQLALVMYRVKSQPFPESVSSTISLKSKVGMIESWKSVR